MKYLFDTHMHSTHSDGDFPPVKVVNLAKRTKLKGIILTDHNTIEGYDEFYSACLKNDLETFMGIEISAKYLGQEIHILGYAKKFNKKILRAGLHKTIKGYNWRINKMIAKLKELGETKINFQKLRQQKNRFDPLAKYDLAKAMAVEHGLPKSQQQQFLKFTGHQGIAYVPYTDDFLSPLQACQLIAKAGGISVLAHPGQFVQKYPKGITAGQEEIIKLIKQLIKAGLKGLECKNFVHNKNEMKFYTALAKKYHLLALGGSDWHGEFHHPERPLGVIGSTIEEFKKLKTAILN